MLILGRPFTNKQICQVRWEQNGNANFRALQSINVTKSTFALYCAQLVVIRHVYILLFTRSYPLLPLSPYPSQSLSSIITLLRNFIICYVFFGCSMLLLINLKLCGLLDYSLTEVLCVACTRCHQFMDEEYSRHVEEVSHHFECGPLYRF